MLTFRVLLAHCELSLIMHTFQIFDPIIQPLTIFLSFHQHYFYLIIKLFNLIVNILINIATLTIFCNPCLLSIQQNSLCFLVPQLHTLPSLYLINQLSIDLDPIIINMHFSFQLLIVFHPIFIRLYKLLFHYNDRLADLFKSIHISLFLIKYVRLIN